MISKKIYLLRHGQTDFNLKKIAQGSGVDSSLNTTGQQQAQAFYNKYKNIHFDKIYTSALCRTVETIQLFLNDGHEYEALKGLNEISWGNREGTIIDEHSESYYQTMITAWRNGDLRHKIEQGESPEDVASRLKTTIQKVFNKEDENQILICMHGRAMRILLCLMLNYPISCMDYFPHSNTSLYQLVYTGKMARIVKFNDLTHLNTMAGKM